jgi:hypothetical protein
MFYCSIFNLLNQRQLHQLLFYCNPFSIHFGPSEKKIVLGVPTDIGVVPGTKIALRIYIDIKYDFKLNFVPQAFVSCPIRHLRSILFVVIFKYVCIWLSKWVIYVRTYSSSFLPSVTLSGPLPRAFMHRYATTLAQYDTQRCRGWHALAVFV